MRLLLALWKVVRFVFLLVLALVIGLLAIFLWPIIAILVDLDEFRR